MPCCVLVLLMVLFPRVVLAVMFFFTTYLNRPYHHNFPILVLGFIFLPLTTLYYAWLFHAGAPVEGVYLIGMILAVVLDLGGWGGGEFSRRRR